MREIESLSYSWESQARQHPHRGGPGIERDTHRFEAGIYDDCVIPEAEHHVDVFRFYDEHRRLRGLLYHYAVDLPPLERKGNVNVLVHPAFQRRGIGSQLVEAAREALGGIDFQQQDITPEGKLLMESIIGKDRVNQWLS